MTYTPEQLREIDAAVASDVMGWRKGKAGINGGRWISADGKDMGWNVGNTAFSPSTNIADAWEVVEKMRSNEWDFKLESCAGKYPVVEFAKWHSVYGDEYVRFQAQEATAPLAICLAALAAVGKPYEVNP